MDLTLSKNHNPNYLAKIVKIDSFKPHPNADRMKLANVNGYVVSVGIDTEPGIFIYFPVECEIHHEYLSKNNLYRVSSNSPNLNRDNLDKGGYIEHNGRVRCMKLRNFSSEGMLMPIDSLKPLIDLPANIDDYIGISFDMINDHQLVKKYIPKITRTSGAPGSRNRKQEKKYENTIVEEQFRFHPDTTQLKNNLYRFDKDTLIQISTKFHGTSAIFCNLLVKKELSIMERLLKFFRINIVDTEYQTFCSSRKVIKDPKINKNLGSGFYNIDIWNLALEVIKPYLEKGMSIYAEIVGYLPNGKIIQKDYDYGCQYIPGVYNYEEMTPQQMYQAKLFQIRIYRITYTNVDGKVFEMNSQQIRHYCEKWELEPVIQQFYGTTSQFMEQHYTESVDSEEFIHAFLTTLQKQYLEKPCIFCHHKVPDEGIVVRIDQLCFEAYKLKSLSFLERESKELDKGIIDIETQENEE